MNESSIEDFVVRYHQRDFNEVWALFTHMAQVTSSVVCEDMSLLRPVFADWSKTLKLAASLRTLLLDKNPLFLRFLDKCDLKLPVTCMKSDLNLLFMGLHNGDPFHVSDIFVKAAITPDEQLPDAHHEPKTYRELNSMMLGFHPRTHRDIEECKRMFDKVGGQGSFGSISSADPEKPNVAPMQLVKFKCTEVDIRDLCDVPIGALGDITITRASIIRHAANILGGVHFDDFKPGRDVASNAFKEASVLYDWDDQSLLNGALVCVHIIAVELVSSGFAIDLVLKLKKLLDERERRIKRGEEPSPWPDSIED